MCIRELLWGALESYISTEVQVGRIANDHAYDSQ